MRKASTDDVPAVKVPEFPGMTVWWLAGEPLGSHQMVLGITDFAPGAAHEVHRHPNAESASVVLTGAGEHLTDSNAEAQRSGIARSIPRGTWHGFANPGDSRVRLATFYAGVSSAAEAGYEALQPAAPHPDELRRGSGNGDPALDRARLGATLDIGLDGRLLVGGSSDGRLRLGAVRLPAGSGTFWPLNGSDVLVLVQTGMLGVYAGGEDRTVEAHEVIHLTAGRTYELETRSGEKVEALVAYQADSASTSSRRSSRSEVPA